jgi:hypothetical protein
VHHLLQKLQLAGDLPAVNAVGANDIPQRRFLAVLQFVGTRFALGVIWLKERAGEPRLDAQQPRCAVGQLQTATDAVALLALLQSAAAKIVLNAMKLGWHPA